MSEIDKAGSLYVPIAEDICRRVAVASDSLRQVVEDATNPLAFVGCEVAALQIRKICELLIAGSTTAHRHDAGIDIDDSHWRPKDAFYALNQQSDHPLPIPIRIELNKNGAGAHHVEPLSQPLPFTVLSKVYGICSSLLHVPSVRNAMRGKLPEFDVDQLYSWVFGLFELAKGHALMLPERRIVVLSTWTGDPNTKPEVFRLAAEGESTLDLASLPKFSLLQ